MINKLYKKGVAKLYLLSQYECQFLEDWYDRNTPSHSFSGFYSTMFFNDVAYREKVNQIICMVMQEKVAKLFPEYEILFANFIVKECNGVKALDLHADWICVDESKYQSYNLWVCLSDAGLQHGQMRFLEGSHLWENNFRFTPYETPPYFSSLGELTQQSRVCSFKRGRGFVYDGRILHGSKANEASTDRLAINLVLKPQVAPSIHWYKNEHGFLEVFKTNTSFYQNYQLNTRPTIGAQKIEEVKFEPKSFTIE